MKALAIITGLGSIRVREMGIIIARNVILVILLFG
jgi:hypothetical protein